MSLSFGNNSSAIISNSTNSSNSINSTWTSNSFEIPSHLTKRRTLVKDRIGVVRAPAIDLPPPTHTYGRKLPPEPEGAGALLSSWVSANPSIAHDIGKRNVYSNVLALQHGFITAKDMRTYAKQHPNIRLKANLDQRHAYVPLHCHNRSQSANHRDFEALHEGPFGMKSTVPEVSFDSIIQGKYVSYHNYEAPYPDVTCIQKKGSMPLPKPTISSDLLERTRREIKENKPRFILNKFKRVGPTDGIHLTKAQRQLKGEEGKKDLNAAKVDT